MMTKDLINKFLDAAMIQRWNDHVRPVDFTELDKQSHKAIIAYILAYYEHAENAKKIDWTKLIEGIIFEFLHRVIMTDIKPHVFHKMMEEKKTEINKHVLEKFENDMKDIKGGLYERFQKYLQEDDYSVLEKRILSAAHYLATNWEFKIIYHACPFIYGIDKTKEEIDAKIEEHSDLIGVQKIVFNKKVYGFVDLCGQLKFQYRWGQAFRIPKTTVLGHMLIVAMMVYITSLENKACDKIKYNNFFSALFHDLPEVLTRDIVSPIKKSVKDLDEIILEYENNQLENKLYPLLSEDMKEEIKYFITEQFKSRIIIGNDIQYIDSKTLYEKYNENKYDGIDGELINSFDQFAAFLEASFTLKHGIYDEKLEDGKKSIKDNYGNKTLAGANFKIYFDFFN